MGVIRDLYYIGAIQTLVNGNNKTVLNNNIQIYHSISPDNNWHFNHEYGLVEGQGDCITLYLSLYMNDKNIKKMVFSKEGSLGKLLKHEPYDQYLYIKSKDSIYFKK